MRNKLKIYKWDQERAKRGETLEILKEEFVELSADHDTARREVQTRALELVGGARVRGCSALAGPQPGQVTGFAVVVET
jgi:hypothetical protein